MPSGLWPCFPRLFCHHSTSFCPLIGSVSSFYYEFYNVGFSLIHFISDLFVPPRSKSTLFSSRIRLPQSSCVEVSRNILMLSVSLGWLFEVGLTFYMANFLLYANYAFWFISFSISYPQWLTTYWSLSRVQYTRFLWLAAHAYTQTMGYGRCFCSLRWSGVRR